MTYAEIINFAVALGIGLLIGIERERKKAFRTSRAPGGVRTFAIVALSGAVAYHTGGTMLLAVVTAGILLLSGLAYWRSPHADTSTDPGLTTEVALVLTGLLGALAVQAPAFAAALGVVVTVLLAARSPLHHFVKRSLTTYELRDGLIFAVATLVILPLLPNRQMGPYEALNPHAIWVVVILIMAVGAAGHAATRLAGVRLGLPFSGFATGFISSTAAIGAMGAQARTSPELLRPAVAGAVLSTVATVVYLAVVIGVTDMAVLKAAMRPLLYAGATAGLYGAVFMLRIGEEDAAQNDLHHRAFSMPMALGLAAMLSGILLLTSAAQSWFDDAGTLFAAALAGFADTHATAVSVASLAATGKLSAQDAIIPILAGVTTNTVSKIIFAVTAGGQAFALRVVPGLVLVAAAAWIGALA